MDEGVDDVVAGLLVGRVLGSGDLLRQRGADALVINSTRRQCRADVAQRPHEEVGDFAGDEEACAEAERLERQVRIVRRIIAATKTVERYLKSRIRICIVR